MRDEAVEDGLVSVSSASTILRSERSFMTLPCFVIVDDEDWLSSLDFLLVVVDDSLSDESFITTGDGDAAFVARARRGIVLATRSAASLWSKSGYDL